MQRYVPKSRSFAILAAMFVVPGGTQLAAQVPAWNVIKPSTTGIPGEEVRLMAFDPAGNLWVGARWLFWGEYGLAMLPAAEVPCLELPGGGFDTGRWTVWSSVHHPIPSQFLSDIEFTADGIVWLASDGGLTRFDPGAATADQMWFTYNAGNSPLIMNEVRSLDADSQGNLWLTNVSVQSANGALFKFNPATNHWTRFEVGNQLPWTLPWKDVNAVLVGRDDRVWLTHSTLGGMAEWNGTNWVLHNCPYPLGRMLEDIQGNIWLTTSQFGLWKWNGTSFQSFDLGSQGTVTALGIDPESGLVYAGAWYGNIYRMMNGNSPQFFLNAENIPGSIHPRPGGDVWINNYGGNGTLGTVRHYNAQGALLERFNSYNSGLPDYFIDNIQSDSAGHLWFSSGEGGLSRFDGTRWRNWGNHNDLSEPYPFAGNEPMSVMLEDRDGAIWMGGNGVAKWDPATGTFDGFWNWENSSFGVMSCTGLAQTADGTIWAGEEYIGVWHLDPAANDWVRHTWAPFGWTANDVRDITTDATGTLWVLTYLQLHRRNADNTWSTWDSTNSPLTFAGLFDLEPAETGGVWIGVDGKLLHFDGSTWTAITSAQAGWPGTKVMGVAVRPSDGKLAVTTQQPDLWPYTGGISVLDDSVGGSWTHYTTSNSPLTHWQVSAPHFDSRGHLWASAMSEGVVQIRLGPVVPGDINGDGHVDLNDFTTFAGCFGGNQSIGPPAGCSPQDFAACDLDGDDDVDLGDFVTFAENFMQ